MNNSKWLFVAMGAIALAAGGYLFFQADNAVEAPASADRVTAPTANPPEPNNALPPAQPQPTAEGQPAEGQPAVAMPQMAQAPSPTSKSLPKLENSDAPILADAAPLFGSMGLPDFLLPSSLIERFVVTIDNLDRTPIRMDYRPIRHVPKQLIVDRHGADPVRLYLSADNAKRYTTYMRVLEILDPTQVASVFRHYSPLFQQAYKELGYPRGAFLERSIEIIDHLLATPRVDFPIALIQPKVLYEFADPELESLSWGQKALIRMGPENTAKVKGFLRALQAELLTN